MKLLPAETRNRTENLKDFILCIDYNVWIDWMMRTDEFGYDIEVNVE
jgi:hypothetical protein